MRVMVLGLRAMFGVQGGIEAHVRAIATQILGDPRFKDIEFEVLERRAFVDAARQVPPLAQLTLTPLAHPRYVAFETIVHTLAGVLYAARKRPDIVHIHGIGPALVAPLARLLGLKIVCTHHGEDYHRDKWGGFARLVLKMGEYNLTYWSNQRIAIAPGLAKRLDAKFGRSFVYIPNPAPQALPGDGGDVLARYGLSAHKYILNVARIVPEKRQLDLIAAFIAAKRDGWKLVLAGGSDHGGDYAQSVERAAAGDPDIILAGRLSGAPLGALYNDAGLFVLPSSHEGLPLVLLEAMTAHLPLLVSDIDNLVDLDLPPDDYFRLGDPGALAMALGRRLAVLDANWRPVDWSHRLSAFSIARIASETVEVYRRCMDQ
ncbi:glycosyl transferase [Pelagibacterium lentulum]|uniref:Glycosyl transferase n=2 Tax=Pelagibacterium lentulum TaxID=2029865 RepID=A0A916R5A2_9HYPH|nr:glycosyl transferase [Pelagibacterium lentulum]